MVVVSEPHATSKGIAGKGGFRALGLLAVGLAVACASASGREEAFEPLPDPASRVVTEEELDRTGQPTACEALRRTSVGIYVERCP